MFGHPQITRRTQRSAPDYKGTGRPAWWIHITIISVTSILIAITALLGLRTYGITRHTVLEQFNQSQLILARSAAAGIQTYFSEVEAALVSATEAGAIRHMTEDSQEYIKSMYLGFIPRTSIRRIDGKGVLRFIYPSNGWRAELTQADYSDEDYFIRAREKGCIVLSGITVNEVGKLRIRMSAPVYIDDAPGGEKEFTGVLVVSFDLRSIADIFITSITSGESGYAWLMNQNGYFLAHNVDAFVGQDAFRIREKTNPELSYESINEIQQKVMAGREGIGRYISGWHRGKTGRVEKLIAYSPIHVIDRVWSVAVVAPVEEVDKIIREAGIHALLTFAFIILFLLLASFISFFFVYRWSGLLRREVWKRTKELRETTDYLNKLIRCANAPIAVLDDQGKVTIFNDTFEKMSGWTEEEICGHTPDILFPDAGRDRALKRLRQAQDEGKDMLTEEVLVEHRDGTVSIGVWNSANIYADSDGALVATIIQGENVTERRKIEQALLESEERFRAQYACLPLPTFTWREKAGEFILIDFNTSARKFTNGAISRFIGGKAHVLYEENPKILDLIVTSFKDKSTCKGETYYRMFTRQESKYITFTCAYVPPDMVILHMDDISQQRSAEEKIQQSEKDLRDLTAQLFSAEENVRKYIAQELHDSIGQHLSSIKYITEMTLNQMHAGRMDAGRTSLDKLISVVQNTIDEISRISMELRPSTLDDLGILATISWFCREYRSIYPGIDLVENIEIKEGAVSADIKIPLFRIIQESLNNVARHSKATSVRLCLAKKNGKVELTISDNGIGFDVTKKVTAQHGGERGFGLLSMKERTKNSGGTFSVESCEGEGASISASWPCS